MEQIGINLTHHVKGGFIITTSLITIFSLISIVVQAETNHMLELAMSLFEDNNFRSCRFECIRTLSDDPFNKQAQFLCALSERRLGVDSTETLIKLCKDQENPPQIKDTACYELSRTYIDKKDYTRAFDVLKQLFSNTNIPSLFIRSGCSLAHLFDQKDQLISNNKGLYCQIDTCNLLFSDEIIKETALISQNKNVSWTGLPAQWVILFYQTQIGPAIGQRCSLHPSCSRYAQQALAKHGFLGIGFIADRMIREPDLVAQKSKPIVIEGRIKYLDPLKNHDFINNYR